MGRIPVARDISPPAAFDRSATRAGAWTAVGLPLLPVGEMVMLLQSSGQFLELVQKSGLVDEAALQQTLDDNPPDDSQQLADRLVQAGLLTRFQAKMLLSGRSKGLVLGPYKILDQIGRGGMGIVYLAQ